PGGVLCSIVNHGASIAVSATADALLWLVAFDGPAELDASTLSGRVAAIQPTSTPEISLGNGGCAFGLAEAEGEAMTEVQVGAEDRAGNFSGWSGRTAIELPPTAGRDVYSSGCNHLS